MIKKGFVLNALYNGRNCAWKSFNIKMKWHLLGHCALEDVLLDWNQTTILEDRFEMLALLGYFGGLMSQRPKYLPNLGRMGSMC